MEDALAAQGEVEVSCEFCNRVYRWDLVDARRIFTAATRHEARGRAALRDGAAAAPGAAPGTCKVPSGSWSWCGVAWLVSEDRRRVSSRLILAGLGLQLALALLLLKLPLVKGLFLGLNDLVRSLQEATQAGTALVFGYLGGGAAPFELAYPQHAFVFAFRALPLILVISALSALLFHWRILPGWWCAASPGCCAAPWASAGPWGSGPRPTSSSA